MSTLEFSNFQLKFYVLEKLWRTNKELLIIGIAHEHTCLSWQQVCHNPNALGWLAYMFFHVGWEFFVWFICWGFWVVIGGDGGVFIYFNGLIS